MFQFSSKETKVQRHEDPCWPQGLSLSLMGLGKWQQPLPRPADDPQVFRGGPRLGESSRQTLSLPRLWLTCPLRPGPGDGPTTPLEPQCRDWDPLVTPLSFVVGERGLSVRVSVLGCLDTRTGLFCALKAAFLSLRGSSSIKYFSSNRGPAEAKQILQSSTRSGGPLMSDPGGRMKEWTQRALQTQKPSEMSPAKPGVATR